MAANRPTVEELQNLLDSEDTNTTLSLETQLAIHEKIRMELVVELEGFTVAAKNSRTVKDEKSAELQFAQAREYLEKIKALDIEIDKLGKVDKTSEGTVT